jgi:hypothetical protein
MKIEELKQVIHEYFRNIYKQEYIGTLDIKKLEPIGYSIKLGLGVPNKPLTIYAELEDEQYLKFLKEELRRFIHVNYGELNMMYPYNCKPLNTKCSCND